MVATKASAQSSAKASAKTAPAKTASAKGAPKAAPAQASSPAIASELWATRWLDAVAAGSSTMSQRSLASIDQRGGGLAAVRKLARRRGVHLLLVKIDDSGADVVAASRSPFKVVC